MDLELLLGVPGATILTSLLAEVIKRAWDPPADIQDRFMPLVAIAIGVTVVFFATFILDLFTRADIGMAIINGIFAGLAACGLYDTVQGVRGK
jgi:hypothetical protein